MNQSQSLNCAEYETKRHLSQAWQRVAHVCIPVALSPSHTFQVPEVSVSQLAFFPAVTELQ